jgi:acetolactate synthase-1/2/3 large subunit
VLGEPPAMPKGGLDARSISAVIARLQPAECIVMDEVLAVGVPYFDASKRSLALPT